MNQSCARPVTGGAGALTRFPCALTRTMAGTQVAVFQSNSCGSRGGEGAVSHFKQRVDDSNEHTFQTGADYAFGFVGCG